MAEEMALAIAEAADLVLNGYAVTRNVADFQFEGQTIINPFEKEVAA